MSNLFVPEAFDERVARLAVGIEPRDPMTGFRIGFPVQVAVDGAPLSPPRTRADPGLPWWAPGDGLERIPRRDSCRHVLVFRDGVKDPLAVRMWDDARRWAPRRIRLRLPAPASLGRVVRPALYPGAAYGVPAGALACRGRVLRGGVPMRWARAEAARGDGAVVGRAHGDDRGEFLLLLEPAAVSGAELNLPVALSVTVTGWDVPPDPAAAPNSMTDPLWDLPLEEAPLAGADAVLDGTAPPAGFRAGATRTVSFGPDGPVSEQFDFT